VKLYYAGVNKPRLEPNPEILGGADTSESRCATSVPHTEAVKSQYLQGITDVALLAPESYELAAALPAKPAAADWRHKCGQHKGAPSGTGRSMIWKEVIGQ
jgi:hypothetical protein